MIARSAELAANFSSNSTDPWALRPGMVVVWTRGEPGSWQGHVGVVSHVEGNRFWSIEGNAG